MAESGVAVALISFGSSVFSAFIVLLGDRYVARSQRESVTEGARIGARATVAGAEKQAQAALAGSQWQSRKVEADEYRIRITDLKEFQDSLCDVRDQVAPLAGGVLPAVWLPIVRKLPLHVPKWIPPSDGLSVQALADRMRRGASRIDLEVPLELAQINGAVSVALRQVATVLVSEIDQMFSLAEQGISALEGWIFDIIRPGR